MRFFGTEEWLRIVKWGGARTLVNQMIANNHVKNVSNLKMFWDVSDITLDCMDFLYCWTSKMHLWRRAHVQGQSLSISGQQCKVLYLWDVIDRLSNSRKVEFQDNEKKKNRATVSPFRDNVMYYSRASDDRFEAFLQLMEVEM